MNINTNISDTHSIIGKTLSFKKKLKKEKNLKVNKISIESKPHKNISNDHIVIQNNQENSITSNTLEDFQVKNKQFTHNFRNSFQSLTLEKSEKQYQDTPLIDSFSKNETFSQKNDSFINSYTSDSKITSYNNEPFDVGTSSDFKTSTQSIDYIYENDKNSTYNTHTKKSNSLSSVSERSGTSFFNNVLSVAQNATNSLTLTTYGSLENNIVNKKLDIVNKKPNNSEIHMFTTYESSKKEEFKNEKKISSNIIPSIGCGELSLNDVKVPENMLKSSVFINEEILEKKIPFNDQSKKTSDNKLGNYNLNQKKKHTLTSSHISTHEKFNNTIKKSGYSSISCLDQQNKHNWDTFKNDEKNAIHILIQKITGITVANSKRNKEFHILFKSIPEDDYLIDDYASALQKDILLHGRMYVSETYVCFNSNIFGWITNLVISFLEIVSIDKKCTAVVFPNAIQITTLHAKYIFSSFISRDTTYDLLINIWRLINPSTRTQTLEANVIDDQNNEAYEKNSIKNLPLNNKNFETNNIQNNENININENTVEKINETSYKNSSKKETYSLISNINSNIESSESTKHQQTECSCLLRNEHYEKQICDEIIKGPLPKVTDLCFGEEPTFMIDFLGNIQKVSEIKLGEWEKDSSGKKIRHISYLKPLYGPVGPKQTHCKIIETIEHEDNDYMTVSSITKTPDVPSGNSFIIKTKYCMMWGKNNYTRIIATCTTDWTKSSWLKSPIERGANEGQVLYIKDLIDAITDALKKPMNEKYFEKKSFKKQELCKSENNINNKKIQKISHKKHNSNIKLKLFRNLKSAFNYIPDISKFITKINIIIIILLLIFFKIIQIERTIQNISPLENVNYKILNHYNSLSEQRHSQKCSESKIIYNIQIPRWHLSLLFDNIKKEAYENSENNKNEELQREEINRIKKILKQIEKNL